ncbi:restriction endonuclease subunit S [Agrobacterium vitis]
MNAERLLQHYEQIADAPDAIARLRRFILDLAVRGKLVPQDFAEEPASELLKRIAAEKARLVKTGTIRKEKMLPPLSSAGGAFELPDKWAWARLGQLAQLVTSGSRDWAKHYSNEGAIFVRMGNLSKDHYRLRLDHVQRVKAPDDGEGTRTRLETGDILISITGDVGMLGLIPEGFGEAYINQHTAMVRPVAELRGRYLAELFRSPFAQQQFNEPQRGIKNSFRLSDVTEFVVPLPPLAEQHRIVAKVDELMALCDELEAARTERETKRDRLAAASLARLNTPDPETFRDDARFALDALPALTARPDQIKQLRQTILNLAVRGKLVPQDPADEPAILPPPKKFAAASGLDAAVFIEFEGKLALPIRWHIAPLAQLAENIVDCPHTTPNWTENGVICVRTSQLRSRKLDLSAPRFVSPEEYLERIERLEPKADDILYSREGGILGVACRVPVGVRLCLGQRLMLIRAGEETRADFLEIVLNSPFITDIAKAQTTGGAAPRVNMSTVRAYPIPLPPLAEQRRIVAKVSDLMALCDQLEASLVSADETRKKLLDALLAEALAPMNAEALAEAAE